MNYPTEIRIQKTADEIERLTDENDHNGALLCMADLARVIEPDSTFAEAVRHIQGLHRLKGSMSQELLRVRSEYRVEILTFLERNLRADHFVKIAEAF